MNSNEQKIVTHSGEVVYHPNFIAAEKAADYFKNLRNDIPWENEVVKMFGKTHRLTRKTAWFADSGATYHYAGTTKKPLKWTETLKALKEKTEYFLDQNFNSCLLNYYPDGNSGMGWHSDNEKEIDQTVSIASLNFGAARKFSFKHKTTKEKHAVHLASGSLLEMKKLTQKHWLHALPKTKKTDEPRINLTFRKRL